jgi:hypothetical protein
MDAIIAAVISGGLALIGVIITSMQNGRKIERKLEQQQTLNNYKIDELTREVRKHNNFAERIPLVERDIEAIKDKINYLHSGKAGE